MAATLISTSPLPCSYPRQSHSTVCYCWPDRKDFYPALFSSFIYFFPTVGSGHAVLNVFVLNVICTQFFFSFLTVTNHRNTRYHFGCGKYNLKTQKRNKRKRAGVFFMNVPALNTLGNVKLALMFWTSLDKTLNKRNPLFIVFAINSNAKH